MGIKYNKFNKNLNYKKYNILIKKFLKKNKTKIIFEPGRSIVGNAGWIISRVIYIKKTNNKNFVILDAAMNDLLRPALYGSTHNIIPSIENNKYHITRAVLESIAFQTNDIIQMMESDLNSKILKIVADGGVSQSDTLLQSQSDITGINVQRTETLESTTLGAAYLAGLATKFWDSAEELKDRKKTSQAFNSNISQARRKELIFSWNKAISRSLDWTK